jgi:hypothetical protein
MPSGSWNASGSVQLGYVPRMHTESIAADIASGHELAALMLREFRQSETGPRVGIENLIAPIGEHHLVVDVDHEADPDETEIPGERLDKFIDAKLRDESDPSYGR